MASFVGRGVNWLRRLSDMTHHSIVLGISAASVPAIQSLPPAYISATCFTAVATQLGSQVWVANVAGPTMFLNMERQKFGDIQARLFPKFGMVGVSTGIMALAAYQTLHPEPSTLTYLLAASAASHILQSFVIFPYVTHWQYQLRALPAGSPERKSAGMKFGISHGISVLMAYAVMGINVYFFYSVGQAISDKW